MNKKMLIGLSVAGLALVGIAGVVTAVVLTQKSSAEPTKPDPKPKPDPVNKTPTLAKLGIEQTNLTLKLSNIVDYKGKTLQVYVKNSTDDNYPTEATMPLTVNAEGTDMDVALTGLVANTTYSVKVTTTAEEGKSAVEVAKLDSVTTKQESATPPPVVDGEEVKVTAVVVGRLVTTAKIEFASLDKYVGRKVIVKAKDSSSASKTEVKSVELDVTDTKKIVAELTELVANTTYSYTLTAIAVVASEGVEPKAEEVAYTSTTETQFTTLPNPTLKATPSATGMAVEVIGLQDYEGQKLVVTLYKKATTPAGATLTASTPPTPTAKGGVVSTLGSVSEKVLKLEVSGVEAESDYELVVTTDTTAKNVILRQTVKTLPAITVEAGTKGPESLGLTLKKLTSYKGKTLLIKYVPVENTQTENEALKSDAAKAVEFDVPATLSTADSATFIEGLLNNKKYAVQVYLKDVPNAPLLATAFTAMTTDYAILEAPVANTTNPRLFKGGVEIKFDKLSPWKDKKLDLIIVPEGEEFVTTAKGYKKTTSTEAVKDAGKLTFTINGLSSEAKYTYKLVVENEKQNLLSAIGSFTSVKAVESSLKELTTEKAVIELSKLDDYVGKKVKLQYKSSEDSVTTWNDLSPSQTVSLANKNNLLFELKSAQFTETTKTYKYKVVEDATTADEVLAAQDLVLKLPTSTATSTTTKFTVNLKALDTLVGKTLVLEYKKKTASEWIAGEEKEVETTSKDALAFSSANTLDSENEYDYKISVKDSYTVVTNKVSTLATPVVGTKDVKATEVKFIITNLSDYVNRTAVLYYRLKNATSWTKSSTEVSVTDANKTNEQEVNVTGLTANSEYEYYFLIKKNSSDASTEDTRLQKQSVSTLATPAASAPAAGGSSGTPDSSSSGGSSTGGTGTPAASGTPSGGSVDSSTPPGDSSS